VFVLGPYSPQSSKDLLAAISEALRARHHYLAFLESDLNLVASLQDSSKELFDLAKFNVFVVTNEGISRGWQFELADLAKQRGDPLKKVGFYYESYEKLQGPVKDFLGNHRMLHEQIVRAGQVDRTINAVVQHVNTFFLHLKSAQRGRGTANRRA
jgi:hypothetical protein